jgi:geranylgeranylglycerol-phosphate geranylgeranyltransferase
LKKFKAAIDIIRMKTSIYACLGVMFGQWLAEQSIQWPTLETVFGGLSMFCLFAFGNISNDLLDIDTDLVSNPQRPLVSGALTKREVIQLSIFFGGSTLLLGGLGGWVISGVALFGLLLVTAYNLYLKRYHIFANFLIGVWGVLPLALISIAEWSWSWKNLVLLLSLFLIVFGNEVLAGIPDKEGDRKVGRMTIATILGEKKAFLVGICIFLCVFPVMGVGLVLLKRPLIYFITFWGVFFPVVLSFGLRLFGAGERFEEVHAQNWVVAVAFTLNTIVLSASS